MFPLGMLGRQDDSWKTLTRVRRITKHYFNKLWLSMFTNTIQSIVSSLTLFPIEQAPQVTFKGNVLFIKRNKIYETYMLF